MKYVQGNEETIYWFSSWSIKMRNKSTMQFRRHRQLYAPIAVSMERAHATADPLTCRGIKSFACTSCFWQHEPLSRTTVRKCTDERTRTPGLDGGATPNEGARGEMSPRKNGSR